MPNPQSNLIRPDFSQYVIHFTKNQDPICNPDETEEDIKKICGLSGFSRLLKILNEKQILATRMPWTNKSAICFTECTWASLLDHAKRYSRFGIGFTKAYLFSRGGGPAIYLEPGLLELQKKYTGNEKPFDPKLFSFMTPFIPDYAPPDYKEKYWKDKAPCDYSFEREWRIPHNLNFEYTDINFVIVDTYSTMAKAPKPLKDAIGREKWLIMDNYETIENLWPVHKIPDNDSKS